MSTSIALDEKTQKIAQEKITHFTQRLSPIYVMIYLIILIFNILIAVSAYYGYNNEWYKNLNKPNINSAVIIGLWILAVVMSFASIFVLWKNVCPGDIANDTTISIFFMITTLLNFFWVVIFFQGKNVGAALLVLFITFVIQLILTMYIWHKKPKAAGFMIPLLAVMIYFMYFLINIATTNDIII